MLGIKSIPWLAHHRIQGDVLFPATSIMLMALDALEQISSKDANISGYHFQEASFLGPIIIRPESVTEMVIDATSLRQEIETSSSSYQVETFSVFNDTYSRCFHAVISVEFDEEANQVDGRRNTQSRVSNKSLFKLLASGENMYHG